MVLKLQCFNLIIRLSAKGTDEAMKLRVLPLIKSAILTTGIRQTTTTRGGEWRGCIAATPQPYMVRTSVKASTTGANKQPENLSLSKSTRFCRMSSHCRLLPQFYQEEDHGGLQNFPQELLRIGCSQDLDLCLYRDHRCKQPNRVQTSSLFLFPQRITGIG